MRRARAFLFLFLILILLIGCAKSPAESSSDTEESPAKTTEEQAEKSEDAPVSSDDEDSEEDPTFEDYPTTEQSEDFSRALAKKGQVYDPQFSVLNPVDPDFSASDPKNYTVMVYMIGSNLESMWSHASDDLLEMENAGLDYDQNNLIVYSGGSQRWSANIPSDRNCILNMAKNEDERIVAQTESNADMGAPSTLQYFLDFCTTYYPADHYMLIFWDHGGGPILGYGNDELFSNDSLLLTELTEAMGKTDFTSHHLDLVGFDACLMGCAENMAVWSLYADYFIGSEELEPGAGWDYSFLSTLNETTDAQEIGKSVIDQFAAYYDAKRSETSNPDLTLSLIDLSKVTNVISAVNQFADTLSDSLSDYNYTQISRRRADTKSFGYLPAQEENGSVFYYDLADLGDLANAFEEEHPESAKAIQNALDEMVLYHYATVENTCGCSIYFPSMNKAMFLGGQNMFSKTLLSITYKLFLQNFTSLWFSTKSRDWSIEEAAEEADCYTIQLSEEQLSEAVSFTYSVFFNSEGNEYTPLMTHCKVVPDENGIVAIPKNPRILVLQYGDLSSHFMPWPCDIAEERKDRTVYHLINTKVADSLDFTLSNIETSSASIDLSISSRPDSDEVQILQVSSSAYGIETAGKSTLDISSWQCLYYNYHTYAITTDEHQNIRPYTEWNEHLYGYSITSLDEGYSFKTTPLSELSGDFYAQLVIEDAKGEQYGSQIMELDSATKPEIEKVYTEEGMLTFEVYQDHAELAGYDGSDEAFEVPSQVKGVPVTEIQGMTSDMLASAYPTKKITLPDTIERIQSLAFYKFINLEEINLPESLQYIEFRAFSYTSLKTVKLPSSLRFLGMNAFSFCSQLTDADLPSSIEVIGGGCFMGCSSLQNITVDGQNNAEGSHIKVSDGVLFSGNGKELLAYPAARSGSYTVPDGTESIGYGAFRKTSQLETIEFPDSLKSIGNYSFFDCSSLQVPEFNEGLTQILRNAFGVTNRHLDPHAAKETETIYIPSTVRFIGRRAFDLFASRQFDVSEENPYYASLDGSLTNCAQDYLVQSASLGDGVLSIPEGILYLEWENLCFTENFESDNFSVYHVYLPASVKSFPSDPFSSTAELIFHVQPDSPAEEYAKQNQIPYDYNTYESFTPYIKEQDGQTYYFREYLDHAALISITAPETTISFSIPETFHSLPVTEVGDGTSYVLPKFTSVTGTEITLSIPDTITSVRSYAFKNCYSISLEHLSDHLERIETKAFPFTCNIFAESVLPESLCYLGTAFACGPDTQTDVHIPASLTTIEPGAFQWFTNVTGFDVDPDNPAYKSVDGVLFTKDGSVLVAGPDYGLADYTIPEGVTRVEDYAFNESSLETLHCDTDLTMIGKYAFAKNFNLKQVDFNEGLVRISFDAFHNCDSLPALSFPMTLKVIEESAFSSCDSLSQLTLNEGLETIEGMAFSDSIVNPLPAFPDSLKTIGFSAFEYDSYTEDPLEPYTLSIGRNLTDLSSWAFTNRKINAYEVDSENLVYAAVDGFLTDHSGEVLLACPPWTENEVHIPEGIKSLGVYSFHSVERMTDLYIPDSVVNISDISLPFSFERVEDEEGNQIGYKGYARIHCSAGSAAEQYAIENNIPYVIE